MAFGVCAIPREGGVRFNWKSGEDAGILAINLIPLMKTKVQVAVFAVGVTS